VFSGPSSSGGDVWMTSSLGIASTPRLLATGSVVQAELYEEPVSVALPVFLLKERKKDRCLGLGLQNAKSDIPLECRELLGAVKQQRRRRSR
jgi:hypothetical protein